MTGEEKIVKAISSEYLTMAMARVEITYAIAANDYTRQAEFRGFYFEAVERSNTLTSQLVELLRDKEN